MLLGGAVNAQTSGSEECPGLVRLSYTDIETLPFISGQRDEIPDPPGLAVEWVLAAVKKTRCNPPVQISRLPPKRLDAELTDGNRDITILAPTPERLEKFHYPGDGNRANEKFALFSANFTFYGKQNTPPFWRADGTLAEGARIGVASGYVTEFIAKQRGWVPEGAPSAENNLRKLQLDRIDLVFEMDAVADLTIAQKKMTGIVKLQPPALTMYYYAPVSRVFQRRYPEFTRDLWKQICSLSHPYKRKERQCDA